jgi:hypothetical protein
MITAEDILNKPEYRVMSADIIEHILHSESFPMDEFDEIIILRDNWVAEGNSDCRIANWLINHYYPNNPIKPQDDFEQFKKQTKLAIAELEAKVAELTYQVELTKYAQVVEEDDRVEFGDVQISNKYGTAVAYVGRFSSGTASEQDNNKCLVAEFGYRFELIKDGDLMGGDVVVIRKNKGDEN